MTEAAETTVTKTETVIVEETTYGPIGKFFRAIKNNPFKTLAATAAAGGAGFMAYTKLYAGGDVVGAAEDATAAVASLSKLLR